ncbi:MAG: SUF system NifU family Fe-S cluster assembly protein [Actinomycetaceae bacterium]|nr:SUF system NifU family Fe-S cluster assembly protein [Arcanobacterium sp.]MDD7504415.1 SUF system NifU family Fe-S cluster assembly protein [Actinomycetaceae bacterium]MDY6143603.1 SUF system NifU family Fe-S cluster assembly protein [Arcanobacterium sp.]
MSDLEQMYQQVILDASRERYGEGIIGDPDGESFQVNPTCGDQVNMQVKLADDGSTFERIAWDGHGCSISQASISIMTQMLEGKKLDDFTQLYDAFRAMMDNRGHDISDEDADLLEDASAFQGVSKFPARIKCALLGWMALRAATDQAVTAYDESHSDEGGEK